MSSLTLLLGGARSGKSSLAVTLGKRHAGRVVYVATATAGDDEMAERIARHRTERPSTWTTIEEPIDLTGALRRAAAEDTMMIVDCLTLWVTNLLMQGCSDADIDSMTDAAAATAADAPGWTVAISNEVGLGIVPETPLGRRFRDVLGRANQAWATAADRSLLLVAGRAVALTDPLDVLGCRVGSGPERPHAEGRAG